MRGIIQGDVSIIPSYRWRDYFSLFSSPTRETLQRDILKGEQATWSEMAYIKSLCEIEFTLGRNLMKLKDESPNANHAHDMFDNISYLSKKRNRSFH